MKELFRGTLIFAFVIASALGVARAVAHGQEVPVETPSSSGTQVPDASPSNGIEGETLMPGQFKRGTQAHDDWWCGSYKDEDVCVTDEQIGCAWSAAESKCKPTPKEGQ